MKSLRLLGGVFVALAFCRSASATMLFPPLVLTATSGSVSEVDTFSISGSASLGINIDFLNGGGNLAPRCITGVNCESETVVSYSVPFLFGYHGGSDDEYSCFEGQCIENFSTFGSSTPGLVMLSTGVYSITRSIVITGMNDALPATDALSINFTIFSGNPTATSSVITTSAPEPALLGVVAAVLLFLRVVRGSNLKHVHVSITTLAKRLRFPLLTSLC